MSAIDPDIARLAAFAASPNGRLEISRERCHRSLYQFQKEAWHVLEPARPFVEGWAIGAICEHLQAVTEGQIRRLLILVPPGMSKSMSTCVMWPAWEWGPADRPFERHLAFSYALGLAVRDNRRTRNLILSAWYRERWGERFTMSRDQSQKDNFENDKTGWRLASSTQATGTGLRGSKVIFDDPISVAEADSDNSREKAVRWFRETLPSRLDDPATTPIVGIMQRTHGGDVAAMAIELGYETLMLPMRFDPARRCVTSIGFVDPREVEGDLLFPGRFPEDAVAELERALGSYATAAQLQQEPAPRGGNLIKVEKLEIVDAVPAAARKHRAWDFASTDPTRQKGSGDPDYTVGALVLEHTGIWYVANIRRERLGPFAVEQLTQQTAEMDRRSLPISIEQAGGSSGKNTIEHYQRRVLKGLAVTGVSPTGSKPERARAFAAAVEAGNVRLVRGDWNEAFIAEARVFPAGAHDDQVDAVVQGFNELANESPFYVGTL